MIQYCRHCIHCVAQDEDYAVCGKRNETVKRNTARNACKEFDFCETDAFYVFRGLDVNEAKYRPRMHKEKQHDGQLKLNFEEES